MKAKKDEEDINELIAAHAEDATQFIASTSTLKDLISKGLTLDKPVIESDQEYIDRIFEEKRIAAYSIIDEMPGIPNIALPPITSLYKEIRECMLFGLNGAAISLSAVLVEFAIKHAIVDKNSGGEVYDGVEWDRVEGQELGPIIIEAEKLKLFSPKDIKQLKVFKNTVRNPYLHYNIKKIIGDAMLSEAKAYNSKTGVIETVYNLKAKDNPFLWQMSKERMDEMSVMNCVKFADSVVRKLFPERLI